MRIAGRPHFYLTRRQALRRFANGFGMLGLAGLLSEDFVSSVAAAGASASNPLAARPPHFPARAKRIISCSCPAGRRTSIHLIPNRV